MLLRGVDINVVISLFLSLSCWQFHRPSISRSLCVVIALCLHKCVFFLLFLSLFESSDYSKLLLECSLFELFNFNLTFSIFSSRLCLKSSFNTNLLIFSTIAKVRKYSTTHMSIISQNLKKEIQYWTVLSKKNSTCYHHKSEISGFSESCRIA